MSKSPNSDIIDKIYFRNIYSCQRKIYWYKVKVMETINAVWEHSYGEDCIPNFSANMEQPRHRWYEFKEGFSLTLVERAIRETKKDNKSTSFTVLDPFSGSGTSPLTALQSRCNAIGYEVNPFMSFVGKTKCQQRTKSIHDYTKELNRILVQRPFRLKSPLEGVSTFTGSGENGKWLFNLDVLRAYEALYQHISLSEYKDFFLLALITSAMQCYSFLLDDATDDSWSSRIKALQDSISAVEREKFKHIEDRDQLKMEYDNLCVSLEKIYRRVQVDFLPIFKKFAKEFTGLDLDMTLVSVTDDGRKMFKFILQIDDTNRDNEFELSESQRFFIDIALRMAIVTFVCSKTTASTSMLIDTPEGSLDIAYETNAGSMFYEYIAANQKMIITANLNSSGLIQTLAGKTKFEKFELISMLKWAKLSSVQNTHFELFERSISTIESKLEG